MADHSSISHFCELTGSTPEVARQFLAGTDLQTALTSFFAAQEDDEEEEVDESPPPTVSAASAAASAAAGSSRPQRTTGGGRFATLGSMRSDENENEDSEDDKKGPTNFFTGGEKSGLAVQNPDRNPQTGNNVVDEILRQAHEGGEPPQEPTPTSSRDKQPTRSAFTGSGMTLGSDETPSIPVPDARGGGGGGSTRRQGATGPERFMQDLMRSGRIQGVSPGDMDRMVGGTPGMPGGFPSGSEQDEEEEEEEDDGEPADQVAIRTLTFWQDGFSIGDGPLMSYDDARNKAILESIKSGQAPRALLNVKIGQRVELRVAKRLDKKFEAPPAKPKKPFSGSGNRLGSPASEMVGNVSMGGQSSMAAGRAMEEMEGNSAKGEIGNQSQVQGGAFNLDQDKPQTAIQVRLADGTKLVARLNLTHTIGDIRNFINSSQPTTRPFLIQTTFPNKVLEDDSQTVEQAGLANAVIVQRWT